MAPTRVEIFILGLVVWLPLGGPGCGNEMLDGMDSTAEVSSACRSTSQGLVINEWLAQPAGVDAGPQWLELHNASSEPLCLDGADLYVGRPWAPKRHALTGVGCMPPDAYWVLAQGKPHPGFIDPWPIHYRYGALPMPHETGSLAVVCQQTVLAAVEYGPGSEMPPSEPGRSTARMADGSFCVVRSERDAQGQQGSPGGPNPGCVTCRDPNGALRAPRPPQLGDLIVIESDVAHAESPGITLHALRDVDAQGLVLEAVRATGGTRHWTLEGEGCLTLRANETVTWPLRSRPADGPAWVGKKAMYRATPTLRLLYEGTCLDILPAP